MNWVKENKFLTVFFIVMVIGMGVLGYEVFSANSAADEAANQYADKAAEYSRLRHTAPFPNKQNLDAYDQQKKEAAKAISDFQAGLAKDEFPLEPLTPERFQDILKASVTAVRAKAAETNSKLPEKGFFLGFEKYESTPPKPEAAAPLGRQLKAIEWVVNQYLSNSVQEIRSLDRTELPEERGGGERSARSASAPTMAPAPGPATGPRPSGGGRPGGGPQAGAGAAREDLVQYHPFQIVAIFKMQKQLANTLNTICGKQAPQFYVLRNIGILNQTQKGPSRVTDPTKPHTKVEYIVGEELVEAAAEFDIVDFLPPTEKPTRPAP